MPEKFIIMLGTDFSALGGITAVVRMYREGGLFARWPLRFLPTYVRTGVLNKLWAALAALCLFCLWVLRGEVGAVHAHVAARGSFWRKSLFLLLGRMARARTLFHLHDGSFPDWYSRRSAPVRAVVRAVMRGCDQVVVLTPTWRDWVQGAVPGARVAVLGNPVCAPAVPSQRMPGHVLFLGRLWAEKGIFDLLAAAGRIRADVPDLHLVCAGDGDAARVMEAARAAGVADCLELPGWIDGEAKAALLQQAALFVLPSYFEGLPMGVLEAMAYGVPVVATEVGGIRDAVGDAMGNPAGLLVPPGRPELLADAMRAVLCDPARQAAMAAAGRVRVAAEFELHRVVERLGALYAELGFAPRPDSREAAQP